MSSLAFLVTELQSLASETRRRHPEIREAAEKSLAILRSSPDQATSHLASDGPQSEDLLRPVFMGCATKNAKVIAISLGSLQRLIALQAVPLSVVPQIINIMNDCMSQGVDIQLRILQTLLSLITNFPAIHGALLGDALILCFKLQESRIAVVSSTAAATLRQLVMFIIDKVVDEDRRDEVEHAKLMDTVLPDGTHKFLAPAALDAYSVLEDLCLLANSEKPHFLRLGSLPKTFALELIESVLTNYHDLFRQHVELLVLLQHHLCPLLLKLLSDKPHFPLTLRSTRVVFLLLKQFSDELVTEAEVFLALLIRIVGGDSDSVDKHATESLGSRPHWMRVLAMEIIRGLCNDADLMRRIWDKYDSQNASSKLFALLVSVLKRLVTEKPALLGVSQQMFGVGVTSHPADSSTASSSSSGHGFDVSTVAHMVATAASATVTGVVGMMGFEVGLTLEGSSMKLQCIDQLDKADAPPIPETYIYLLGLQCLVSLCEGFASLTLPLFNSIVVQRPRIPGESAIKAPPALDIGSLPADQPSTKQLKTVRNMVETGWPGLLAALSFIVATNLSEELFGDILQSYQSMANVSGMLGLATPRDAFLTSLAKFAIPSRVVSSLDLHVEPSTPRTSNTFSDNLGLTALSGSGPTQPPGLSERNLACLKVLVSSALFLAGSLGESWYNILEALQNADYVLTSKGAKQPAPKRIASGSPAPQSGRSAAAPAPQTLDSPQFRHPLLVDVDAESVQRFIQRLFDSSKNLEDSAFHDFIAALCKLSAEMVEMQSTSSVMPTDPVSPGAEGSTLSPGVLDSAHRRRISGIHLPRTLRSGDFGINKIGQVSRSNILRLTHRPAEIAWTPVTTHLLSVLRNRLAPHALRLQAARTLDDTLLLVPRNLSASEEKKGLMQRNVLDVLAEQVAPDPITGSSGTVVEVRKMGLETLHEILQSSGHTIVVGWETVFEMLGSVCEPTAAPILAIPQAVLSPSSPRRGTPPLGYTISTADKGSAALVRVAFQSLTLVCDSLVNLTPEHLRLCIGTLGRFGRQWDTNIALTAAGSLLWGVSDSLQAKRKDSEQEAEYSALWMFLLLEVLGLCTDPRPEVRVGAIQTLFRTLQLYGATLSLETWEDVLWKVTYPLLDSITAIIRQLPPSTTDSSVAPSLNPDASQAWGESKTLALQSIGGVFRDYLPQTIIQLASFESVWNVFVQHVEMSFLFDRPDIGTAALRCLERANVALEQTGPELQEKVSAAWQRTWRSCDDIGGAITRRTPAQEIASGGATGTIAFDQESLLAFVDVVKSVRNVSRLNGGSEWPLERLVRLVSISKGVLTYPNSRSYRPDIDGLTPLQAAVLDIINEIDLNVPGSAPLVLRDLSEIATLPFLASFDVPDAHSIDPVLLSQKKEGRPVHRVTYIGLTKKVMPLLLDVYLRFAGDKAIYNDETVEAMLSAYSVPIKLKYECPAPSKFGNDKPLWKTASSCFLRIVKECMGHLVKFEDSVSDVRVEGIWGRIIDGFRGAILADCRVVESWPLEEQEAEERFDLALIATLEVDVIPVLGNARVPDHLIIQLAKVLHQGSILYDSEDVDTKNNAFERTHLTNDSTASIRSSGSSTQVESHGATTPGTLLPRERFAYWCLDLLFLICSDIAKDHEMHRRRVAALCLPSLLHRCGMVLLSYLADAALRGNYPFPRAREEELVYILRKLLLLQLWPATLWVAVSNSPSKYFASQPDVDSQLPPSKLIADAVKRSTKAHLFHFYGPLCQISSLPRKPPSAWVASDVPDGSRHLPTQDAESEVYAKSRIAKATNANTLEECNAHQLASACLKEVGKEMGVL